LQRLPLLLRNYTDECLSAFTFATELASSLRPMLMRMTFVIVDSRKLLTLLE